MKNQYLNFALAMAQKAAKELMKGFGQSKFWARKEGKTIKSAYDLKADKIIKQAIEKQFPSHSYLTEETGLVKKDSDFFWVVDPLDGTGNFVNLNPFFSVSIALFIKNQPVLGIIEAPAISQRYLAVRGQGAWLVDLKDNKKKRVRVSDTANLKSAYMLVCEGGSKNRPRIEKIIKQFYSRVTDFRKFGSASIELAWVGLGRTDVYITPQIFLWDIAAGVLFVKEAGARILDFSSRPYSWQQLLSQEKIDLVAVNSKLKVPKINF